jgi:HEAT repeat protein
LRTALADADPSVQALAAACLANAGADAAGATDDLARVLTLAKHPEVRRNCAIAIGRIGYGAPRTGPGNIEEIARGAIPALVEAMKPLSDPITDPYLLRAHEEVRVYAAEGISRIGQPHNEKALAAIRDILKKDTNQGVRQHCVEALFNCRDLDKHGLVPVLAAILDEKNEESTMVRYDTARVLAQVLRDRAPDRTCDVLVEMINDRRLKVNYGSGAAVEGVGAEGSSGTSKATASLGGDARFMAAQAMEWLGDKARKHKTVMASLRKASDDDEARLKDTARKALKALESKD